uniref:Uncharacterized protein n=1 Tax=Timema shepardi TaxID=629360 RepID=A0A7R9G5P6_TIMSH|nr:unnamed protein product [Timema shepardi]
MPRTISKEGGEEETGEVRLARNVAQQWGRGFYIRLSEWILEFVWWNSLVPESWKTSYYPLYDVLTPHTMSKLMRVTYSSPMASLVLTDSSQPTAFKSRSTEHSRVEMDLDAGVVTGYSDQVQFPVTPKQRSDKDRRCSQQAVIRLELGGQMQIASLTMEYKEDPPRLWTFHMSDSEKAEGYGSITITNSSLKGSLEMHVVNQQLRVYSRWPRSTQEVPAATPSHSQWMSVRIVDSTAKKLSKVELTLSMRGNSLRWQDGRLAHDFSAPPGLFYDNESVKNKSIIYVSLNRVIGADWRSGTGLCKVIVKLMDNEGDEFGLRKIKELEWNCRKIEESKPNSRKIEVAKSDSRKIEESETLTSADYKTAGVFIYATTILGHTSAHAVLVLLLTLLIPTTV